MCQHCPQVSTNAGDDSGRQGAREQPLTSGVVIIDYGVGNVGSVLNVLKRIGGDAVVSGRAEDIASASHLILPGIGAFDNGARRLRASGLVPILRERAIDAGVPLLGICLGMQLLMHRSEEGAEPGSAGSTAT